MIVLCVERRLSWLRTDVSNMKYIYTFEPITQLEFLFFFSSLSNARSHAHTHTLE